MIRQALIHKPKKLHKCDWCQREISGVHYYQYGGEEYTGDGRPVAARICLSCLWLETINEYGDIDTVRFVVDSMSAAEKLQYLTGPLTACKCGDPFGHNDYCEYCCTFIWQLKKVVPA